MSTEKTGLTHIDASGEAHMVDVGDKAETARSATASSYVRLSPMTPTLRTGSRTQNACHTLS